jgi:hypothetical protein
MFTIDICVTGESNMHFVASVFVCACVRASVQEHGGWSFRLYHKHSQKWNLMKCGDGKLHIDISI